MSRETPPEGATLHGHRAGFASRVAAAAIDVATVLLLGLSVLLVASFLRYVFTGPPFQPPVLEPWLGTTTGACVAVGYLAVGWSSSGRTVGMQVLGLRLVGRTGRTLGIGASLLRGVLCVVFPVGLLWILVSRRNASVQDVLVGTAVIYDWAYRVPDSPTANERAATESGSSAP